MEELKEKKTPHVKNRRLILGVIAIFFGLLILVSNFGFLTYDINRVLFSWQMILIVIGTIQVLNHKEKPTGYILLAIGFIFLMPKVFDFDFDFWSLFWPVILIGVGVSMIFFHRKGFLPWEGEKKQSADKTRLGIDYLDEVNVFAGSKRNVTNKEFKGGKVTSIFGGGEFNLSQARLAEGTQVIDVTCIFGGMSLVVPPDWDVHVEVTSIFGAFEDKRTVIKKSEDQKGTLIIKGVAIFGGGDVKSY